jgi:hypothetical protein
MKALSNMGLLSRFVGMLTDSRSFLSYPRHEYFRRIICNLFGEEIDNGELPNDHSLGRPIIQDISYIMQKKYFNLVMGTSICVVGENPDALCRPIRKSKWLQQNALPVFIGGSLKKLNVASALAKLENSGGI